MHLRKRKKLFFAIGIAGLIYILFVPSCKFNDPFSTVITDIHGQLLGARVANDGQWRFPETDTISDKIVKATLAFEDRYFYYHPGVNPVSMFRALFLNMRAHKVVSGGSTITMQTIRLYRKGKPRTVAEKIIEIIAATRLELSKSKKEILSMYASHAPYGGNVVGIEAASWRYFGTNCNRLSWAEAATLAVLPNSPSLIHPGRNRNLLLKKRNLLLHRMNKIGWIDHTTLVTALAEGIPQKPNPMPAIAPHMLNRVYQSFPETSIRTTLDATLQTSVNDIVNKHHNILKYNQIHNLSVIIIEVETGDIKVYVGNCGYGVLQDHANDVDIITSPRSTGSLLKPLLYAAMIDDGKLLPGSLIIDVPINLGGFSPQNFDGSFQGAIPAKQALSRSLNVPAVQLLKQFGIERFSDLLKNLGMNTITKTSGYYGLSLILGGAEGTLEEMTNVYASLSRVLSHYNREGGKYYTNDYRPAGFIAGRKIPESHAVQQAGYLSASAIWAAYQAMIEVNRPDTEAGWQYFTSSRKIAWKTGTSFGYRDGWAIGTNPKFVVGVWTGNADGEGRPGLTGIACAAPILFDIFGILPESSWFAAPSDELVYAEVCRVSGFLAGENCILKDSIRIPLNGKKSSVCPYHKLIHLSYDEKYRVTSECCPVDSMKHLSWFVLPPVPEWYYMKHHADYKRLPVFRKECGQSGQKSMGLVYPREEVRIFIPRTLSGEKGRVVFEAVHNNPDATIFWHIDDQFISSTRFIHQIEVLPSPGKHKLILIDENGEELVKSFEAVEP